MNPLLILSVLVGYFLLLITISYFTSKKATNEAFFIGNKQSPWYVVAFGMIGASLSGVTFISIPGEVGNSHWTYFQLVLGYLLGYWVIAQVLLPLYYRLNLITIYTYLKDRFGTTSYKTGSIFFIISRVIGASFRMFLVCNVLYIFLFSHIGINFPTTVILSILLIWLYTFRAGIKTIVWTDTLQTTFMILSMVTVTIVICNELNWDFSMMMSEVSKSSYSQIFEWNWASPNNFFKQFFSGAFIAIVMTGLDQDMMQKNLSCRTLKDSQKNVLSLSWILIPVNLLFLGVGTLFYIYINTKGIAFNDANSFMITASGYKNTDDLFPLLAFNYFPTIAAIAFLLGIVAAAFSSADSALTALTTTFCIDIIEVDQTKEKRAKRTRIIIHILFSVLMLCVIMLFKSFNDSSVIKAVFTFAGYTYGPLLGIFAFGLITKRQVIDKLVIYIAVFAPIACYVISTLSLRYFGYKFGYELLMINGLIVFVLLWITSLFVKSKPNGVEY